MKHILLAAVMILSSFANANEMSNPCVYHPDLPGCAGNNRPMGQTKRVINIPDRWGAIYFNPVNKAVGYSENNTKSEESANKEALANCIKAGGGENPVTRSDGKGCRRMSQYRNVCAAFAVGPDRNKESRSGFAVINDDYVEKAEQKALDECGRYSDKCAIKYSGCSRHPDYRY
jgi:hypothetical protein